MRREDAVKAVAHAAGMAAASPRPAFPSHVVIRAAAGQHEKQPRNLEAKAPHFCSLHSMSPDDDDEAEMLEMPSISSLPLDPEPHPSHPVPGRRS